MSSVQEVIKSALSRNKFCKTMYQKLIKEKQPSQNMYLAYSCYLATSGNLPKSLSALYYAVKNFSTTLSCEKVTPVISQIIDFIRENIFKSTKRDIFSCPFCSSLFVEPVTLFCGHSYCKNCVATDSFQSCVICQAPKQSVETNVLVTSLTEKLFAKELQAITLRTKANKFLENKQYLKAVELYTEAHQLAPHDHLILSSRSYTFLLLGRAEEALEDANEAVSIRPEWPEGHLRKSEVLLALGREEGALVSLFISAIFETCDLSRIAFEITKLLLMIMRRCALRPSTNSSKKSSASDERKDKRKSKEDKKTTCDLKKCLRKRRRSLLAKANQPLFVQDVPVVNMVNKFLTRLSVELGKIQNSTTAYVRALDPTLVQISDFECSLCYMCFWEPVSTPCGHTFCRSCLERSLDHAVLCPLCKSSLRDYLAENSSNVNELIENAMKTFIPEEYKERGLQHDFELSELAKAGKDPQHEIPIFVATIAIPSIACPLHVYEPRYRLMIRRVMEAGTKEFGMCMPSKSGENGYSDFGTMLEVREVNPIDDGRRIVNSVGSRRFKCLSKGVRDGYNTATIEFLKDEDISEEALPGLKILHDTVIKTARNWFDTIDVETKRRILGHYGDMPSLENQYWLLPNGPVWMWWLIAILPLEPCFQMRIIQEKSLCHRLNQIYHILKVIVRQMKSD